MESKFRRSQALRNTTQSRETLRSGDFEQRGYVFILNILVHYFHKDSSWTSISLLVNFISKLFKSVYSPCWRKHLACAENKLILFIYLFYIFSIHFFSSYTCCHERDARASGGVFNTSQIGVYCATLVPQVFLKFK